MNETSNEETMRSRRTRRRLPIHGVLVAIDAPHVADQHWVVDALDINADGLGLVLPPELPEGTAVELTFKLREDSVFSRMPALVRHQMGSSGGVRFEHWPESERIKLLDPNGRPQYLLDHRQPVRELI